MEEIKGRVHSFESFGTVDGPGIRFVVFLQGCHLNCKYCHNRDTWSTCGGTLYTVDEILVEVDKYKHYFMPSGGGVTISGGEPLLQLPFLLILVSALKSNGIHVAIDTSGNFTLNTAMKKLIDMVDLFLLDIKCTNDEICKELTGVSNQNELAFANYLSEIGKPMWIRQVLVPGITDHEEDLLQLKEFIHSLKTVQKVEILPYHDAGKFKWKELEFAYPLENVRSATVDDVKRATEILEV